MPAKKPPKAKPKPVVAVVDDDEDFGFAGTGDVAVAPVGLEDKLSGLSAGEIDAIAELARRFTEALELYRPLPFQEAFHRSESPERIVWGSNRSGKTLSTCVEVARACTGQDPYDKYPKTDGRCVIVCKNGDTVGQVIFKKLFKPNSFRIIRDLETGLWRTYEPSDPAEAKRKRETKPAPPLIPSRMIQSISYDNKAEGIPSQVRLTNGWEINFYSSMGSPTPGTDLDLVMFDEEIEGGSWYEEMAARLIDRGGRFIWGATPQEGTPELFTLHERAVEHKKCDLPGQIHNVEEFFCLMADNPYMTEEQKKLFEAKMTDAQKHYRIHGQFVVTTYRVYEEFTPETHCVDPFDIPPDWTHYMFVDPGRQVCAAILVVVAPPDHPKWGGRVIFYDELYIRKCTAYSFGEIAAPKIRGRNFQAFVIDRRGGRITDIGGGKEVQLQYQSELEARGIKSNQTGSGFLQAFDNLDAGIEHAKGWLQMGGGKPILAVFTTLKYFLHEIKYYHNRKKKGELVDTPEQRNNHTQDCFRYAASHGCPYVQPKGFQREGSYAWKAVQAKLARKREMSGRGGVSLGPG